MDILYLRQKGYVLGYDFCLCVCLFVCVTNNPKSPEYTCMTCYI